MKNVVYRGREDVRILTPADLKKAGGSLTSTTSFQRGQALEVNESVASALLENPKLFGHFEEAEVKKAVEEKKPRVRRENRPSGSVDTQGTSQVDLTVKARSRAR